MLLDEQEFHLRADEALSALNGALVGASEEHGFEPDLNNGALTVEFEEPPAKFVVSPNSPVRQVWVSALAKSYKLDWNTARGEFVLASSGQSLKELIAEQISRHLGEEIAL